MQSQSKRLPFSGFLSDSRYWPLWLLAVVWVVLFFDAISSAARIWYVSEIFSHGFFILPGAVYLIWRMRKQIQWDALRPSYAVLPGLVLVLLLGLFGYVGGIQVFQHFAAFTSFSLLVWFLVGNTIALKLWFPLLFVLFSVPVGEELIPTLQAVTADMSVWLLGFTGIPIFNTGLYIEIPNGKFVVAEACSGIRFFIGSLVFGAIYGHLTYQRFSFKCLFMVLAIIVPILANALRVTGIVMAGYYSDMTVAVGADHLVYGWFFFAIVLVLLIVVGELLKKIEKPLSDVKQDFTDGLADIKLVRRSSVVAIIVLMPFLIWKWALSSQSGVAIPQIELAELVALLDLRKSNEWKAEVNGASVVLEGRMNRFEEPVDLAFYWFAADEEGQELVSRGNRWYDINNWSLRSNYGVFSPGGASLEAKEIVSSSGAQRLIVGGYMVGGSITPSPLVAKLRQTWDKLFGGQGAAALLLVSRPLVSKEMQSVRDSLVDAHDFVSNAAVRHLP